jgi:hypothetical protein
MEKVVTGTTAQAEPIAIAVIDTIRSNIFIR